MEKGEYDIELKKWFLKKKELHFQEINLDSFHKKGEVWYVDFGINIGSEFNKVRPAITISNKSFSGGGNILVVPITKVTNIKNIINTDIVIESKILQYKSIIKINHIKDISKKRLIKKLGRVSDNTLKDIDLKLKLMFDIRE